MGISSFRAKERNSQRLFSREASRHQGTKQMGHIHVIERAFIRIDDMAKHFSLAFRPVEAARLTERLLGSCDLDGNSGTLIDQLQHFLIDSIDSIAQLLQFFFCRAHILRYLTLDHAHFLDAFDGAYSLQCLLGDHVISVDQCIGNVVMRLIDHIANVQVAVGHVGRDLA